MPGIITPQGGMEYEVYQPYSTPPSFDPPEPELPDTPSFDPSKMQAIQGKRAWETIGFDVETPSGSKRVWLSDQERILANSDDGPAVAVIAGVWNRAHGLPSGASPDQAPTPMQPPVPVGPPPDHSEQIEALDLLRTKFPGVEMSPVSHDRIKISFPDDVGRADAKQVVGEIDGVLAARRQSVGDAVRDYKQQEQNAAIQGSGLDKSMEYRGMPKGSPPPRLGRGTLGR